MLSITISNCFREPDGVLIEGEYGVPVLHVGLSVTSNATFAANPDLHELISNDGEVGAEIIT